MLNTPTTLILPPPQEKSRGPTQLEAPPLHFDGIHIFRKRTISIAFHFIPAIYLLTYLPTYLQHKQCGRTNDEIGTPAE